MLTKVTVCDSAFAPTSAVATADAAARVLMFKNIAEKRLKGCFGCVGSVVEDGALSS